MTKNDWQMLHPPKRWEETGWKYVIAAACLITLISSMMLHHTWSIKTVAVKAAK